MRRSDRELSRAEAEQILLDGEYGVLSTVSADGQPYGVPMNYAYKDGCIFLHCSSAGGLKTQNLEKNPRACFTVVSATELLPDKFATRYLSAVCFGTVEILKARDDKREGIECILRKYSPDFVEQGLKYIDAAIDRIYVLHLRIETLIGKGRKN